MKRKVIFLGIIFCVSAFLYLQASSDYRWANANIDSKKAEGWTLVATIDNYVDITHPWSIFRKPVTGLWFLKTDKCAQVDSNIYALPQVSMHFDYEKTDQVSGINVYDVINHRSAFLEENVELSNIKVNELDWTTYETNTPGAKLQLFVETMIKSRTNEN